MLVRTKDVQILNLNNLITDELHKIISSVTMVHLKYLKQDLVDITTTLVFETTQRFETLKTPSVINFIYTVN